MARSEYWTQLKLEKNQAVGEEYGVSQVGIRFDRHLKNKLRKNNEKYKENRIQYIEFIRETRVINFFINIYKRRRFAIYYTSVIFFVNLLSKKDNYNKHPKDFYQSILKSA